jgi:TolB-like protein
MRVLRAMVLLILPLTLAVPQGWSVDSKSTDASVCVFPLANLSPNGAQQEHQKPLSEAVRQEFEAVGFHVLADSSWSTEAARLKLAPDRVTEASQALLLGERAGADMAVTGFYWMENDRVLVSLQCYDVKAGTLITGFLHTWRFNLGFYNSIHAEIADLVQRVVFLSAPKLIALKNDVRVDEITFTSPQEGMEVLIEGQRSVGRIKNGTLVFQTDGLKAGTQFMVEKRQEGFHTLQQTVIAAPQIALTTIPRANNLSWEIDWTGGQLEGAGAALRWYPKPDWIMVNYSEYLYTQIPFVPNASWPIHADSELLAGFYLFRPPEAGFRFGISAGVGTIFTWIPATTLPIFTDVYINVFSLWSEWRSWGLPVFVRIDVKIPLEVGNYLLGSDGSPLHWGPYLPPITLGVVIPWK